MQEKKPRGEKRVLSRQDIASRKRGLSEKKQQRSASGSSGDKAGRRFIVGVFLAAAGLFGLVSLASFDPHTANAAGPVGYALADLLNGALGLGAYAFPLGMLYAAGLLWIGPREGRRGWLQLLGIVAWIGSGLVLLHLLSRSPTTGVHPRPLAGHWGAVLAESMRELFSTVGTVIIVIAIALAATVIATERAALKAAYAVGRASRRAGLTLGVLSLAAGREAKKRFDAHREQAAQDKLERAAFLAQLEADEEEIAEAELAAQDADDMAEEAFRLANEEKAEPEPKLQKTAQPMEKSGEKPVETLPASSLAITTPPLRKRERKMPALGAESASPAAPAVAAPIINAPAAVPATSIPSIVAATPPTPSRMPVIIEPKAPPQPTATALQKSTFEFVGNRTSFTLPPIDVLECEAKARTQIDKDAFLSTAEKLRAKLADFGITGEVQEIRPGPVVTMYEFLPGPGIKVSKIASLADDLAMAMEAMRVRIVAPIPGKGVVGIEVPNKDRETVYLKEIAEQDAFTKSSSKLTMCLGKDIEGMPYVLDLAKAPHLLMAGTTGSGKSVAVNSMIMSLLLKATPEEVRFIMVDPKRLELSVYEGIPHLLLPVVTDPKKAALALRWAVEEMERRYQVLSDAGVRNITGYNKLVESVHGNAAAMPSKKKPMSKAPLIVDVAADETEEAAIERRGALGLPMPGVASPHQDEEVRAPLEGDAHLQPQQLELDDAELPKAKELQKLPYIVVIIDELADLMMVASREVEMYIARLAQMARAAGIHLMVATQRPSTDVVTGVIKANFPTRISFMLRTKPDSMTILGTIGAEALLGMGDMLVMPPTSAHLQRVHGAYVSEAEIKRAVDHLKAQGKPVFDDSILKPREDDSEGGEENGDDLSDELYDQALATVCEMRQVSISMLQRKMRIGYNRAARMIERMEKEGVVGAADGAKPREVLLRPVGDMPGAGAV